MYTQYGLYGLEVARILDQYTSTDCIVGTVHRSIMPSKKKDNKNGNLQNFLFPIIKKYIKK